MALIDTIARAAGRTTQPRRRFSLHTALTVWRTRRALARLDAAQLADIGVTPRAARREATKSIWDVPTTWRD
ncbi:MAG: DUF1127 domain-containing protein [Pseudomonadota bacterium]